MNETDGFALTRNKKVKHQLLRGEHMLNACGVIRLGGDPELRFLQNGDPMVSFSAVVDSYKKGGEEVVTWARFKAFGETAKVLQTYLKRGHLLQVVDASIRPQKYTKNNGVAVETVDFVINAFRFLPNKKKEEPVDGSAVNEEQSSAPVVSSDDIPF